MMHLFESIQVCSGWGWQSHFFLFFLHLVSLCFFMSFFLHIEIGRNQLKRSSYFLKKGKWLTVKLWWLEATKLVWQPQKLMGKLIWVEITFPWIFSIPWNLLRFMAFLMRFYLTLCIWSNSSQNLTINF